MIKADNWFRYYDNAIEYMGKTAILYSYFEKYNIKITFGAFSDQWVNLVLLACRLANI